MSRIGRLPITVFEGVTVKAEDGIVTVKGPLGQLEQKVASNHIHIKVEDGKINITRSDESHLSKSMHGLYRALVANMVNGVKNGYTKKLIVNGVGFKCSMSGSKLIMNIGFSHPVEIDPPKGVTIACTTPTDLEVKGISKEMVGQVAAKIRASRPVEPYHAYGIRYSDEVVVRKEGKTAGK